MDNKSCGGIFSNLHDNFIENAMISAYFIHQGFVSSEALPERERLESAFFIKTIFSSLVQFLNLFCPTMTAQGHCLQIDNATSHNSALSLHKTEELRFTRSPELPYSPDLTLCDFLLFGHLRKELQWMNFISQNRVTSAMTAILNETLIRMLSEMFDQWIERFDECSTNSGEYV
jgi:hypothetical protein